MRDLYKWSELESYWIIEKRKGERKNNSKYIYNKHLKKQSKLLLNAFFILIVFFIIIINLIAIILSLLIMIIMMRRLFYNKKDLISYPILFYWPLYYDYDYYY